MTCPHGFDEACWCGDCLDQRMEDDSPCVVATSLRAQLAKTEHKLKAQQELVQLAHAAFHEVMARNPAPVHPPERDYDPAWQIREVAKERDEARQALADWKRDEWPTASQDPKWQWFNARLNEALKARDEAQGESRRLARELKDANARADALRDGSPITAAPDCHHCLHCRYCADAWRNDRRQAVAKAEAERDAAQAESIRQREALNREHEEDTRHLRKVLRAVRNHAAIYPMLREEIDAAVAPTSPPAPTYSTPALQVDPEAEAALERRLAEKRTEVKAEPNQCCAECRRVVGDGPGKSNCAYDFACACHKAEPAQGAKGEDESNWDVWIGPCAHGRNPWTRCDKCLEDGTVKAMAARIYEVEGLLEEAKAEGHAAGIADGMERAAKIATNIGHVYFLGSDDGSQDVADSIAAAIRKPKERPRPGGSLHGLRRGPRRRDCRDERTLWAGLVRLLLRISRGRRRIPRAQCGPRVFEVGPTRTSVLLRCDCGKELWP